MGFKKQHFVPATYLKAWCDITSPPNYKPYVWVYPREGGEAKSKAPEKIFWETDFYTIKNIDGERDLVLEHGLSQLENKFAKLRDKKLSKWEPLTVQDKSILFTFTAAMYARTKARRNHLQNQWQKVLDMGNRMTEWAKTASPDQLKKAESIFHAPKNKTTESLSMDDVKYIVENTIQSSLGAEIETIASALAKMHFVIVDTIDAPVFITSDNPCVLFDRALQEKPIPFGAGGLISPSLEISLAISPTQCIFFGKEMILNYLYLPIQVTNPLTDTLNCRTWAYANEYFISNQNTTKFSWLKS